MKIKEIDTPAIIIDRTKLISNIEKMQGIANNSGVSLRPHAKTHKIPEICHMQINSGAVGITVAKLGEAEVMLENGIRNIRIANIITGIIKLNRLKLLNREAEYLTVNIDSIENAIELNDAFEDEPRKIKVLIEIDTGFGRAGINDITNVSELASRLKFLSNVEFEGLITHAGESYLAKSNEEIIRIGNREGEYLVAIKDNLSKLGIEITTVSVGSTPTAPYSSKIKGVTEIRPGNYVFHDMIQYNLEACNIENCSLSILATVISKPSPNRIIIDAGSKAISPERATSENSNLNSFGKIIGNNGILYRLSEEHGFIECNSSDYDFSEKIRIIPNHACTTTNLYNKAFLVEGDKVIGEYEIKARGKSQ